MWRSIKYAVKWTPNVSCVIVTGAQMRSPMTMAGGTLAATTPTMARIAETRPRSLPVCSASPRPLSAAGSTPTFVETAIVLLHAATPGVGPFPTRRPIVMTVPSPDLLDGLMQHPSTGPHIGDRLGPTTAIIPDDDYEPLGRALQVRQVVASFEGSVAIGAVSLEHPDRLLLALRGSGQALYVGITPSGYLVASEPYGLVEQCSSYVRLDGEAGGADCGEGISLRNRAAATTTRVSET